MATKARRKSRKASSRPVKNRVSAKEALERIQSLSCPKSEIAVEIHFSERGIEPSEIHPRQNVLTFNAWRALGRTVRKGERGFSFTAWVPITGKQSQADESSDDTGTDSGKRAGKGGRLKPRRTTVFHECQTVPIGQQDGGPVLKLHPDQIEALGQAVALEVLDRESKGEIEIVDPLSDDPGIVELNTKPDPDPAPVAVAVESETESPTESTVAESSNQNQSYWGW